MTADGTSFDDIPTSQERSTLKLFGRAIREDWPVTEQMRKVVLAVVLRILSTSTKEMARIRAGELITAIDFKNKELMLQLLDREADAAVIGMNAEKTGGKDHTDVEEILMVRVRRMRKENPIAATSLERVINAGLRRLDLPEGNAAGDGAAAGGEGGGVRDEAPPERSGPEA